MARPRKAARVSSTKPDSLSVSVWMATCTSCASATDRQQSIAAGVVPQSSCSLRPRQPATICSTRPLGPAGVPLAEKAEVHRDRVGRLQHARDVPGARRAGGRVGAGRRARAAADHRRHARHQRVVALLRRDEMNVRIDAARGGDAALAGDDLRPRADDDVDARLNVGVAGLADAADAAVLDADVGLDDARHVDNQRVRDHRVRHRRRPRAGSGPCRRGSPCRRRTSPPRRRPCGRARPRSPDRCRPGARDRRSVGPYISA